MADWLSSLIGVGGSIASAYIGAESAQDAAAAETAALTQATQASDEAIAQGRADITGTYEAGLEDLITGFQGAISVLEQPGSSEQAALAFSGALGTEAQQAAYANFTESPGQEYIRNQQEQALLRNAAAIGGLGGSNVRTALQEQAANIAATNEQQYFSNLASLISPEQARSTNIANILSAGGQQLASYRAGIGSNLAGLAVGDIPSNAYLAAATGEAQAGGITGTSNAYASGLNNLAATLGALVTK